MSRPRNHPTEPLRDPRAATHGRAIVAVPDNLAAGVRSATLGTNLRAGSRQLYGSHLRTATSKAGDVYSGRTIESYLEAVDGFGDYLTRVGFTGDYGDVDVDTLNAYLAEYRAGHTQGGTNTKLRRLRTFYGWLELMYEEAVSPWRSGRVAHYAPSAPPPSALAGDVLATLLKTCKGKTYEDVRDTAMLLVLATGVRRDELRRLHVEDVSFADQTIQVAALKDSRRGAAIVRVVGGVEHRAGRLVPLSDRAMMALNRWLRMRAKHKLVQDPGSGPLWYATRNRGALTGNGILRMVKRRAEEAGYDPGLINVHAFRHTRADQLLAAGLQEGDVMGVMGWKDRTMIDRYAANQKNRRAIEAVRRAGLT